MATEGPLKHFGVIKSAAENSVSFVTSTTAYNRACGLYSGLHENKMLKPTFNTLESTLAPLVGKAPEIASMVLSNLDTKLDTGVLALTDLLQKAKSTGTESIDSLKAFSKTKYEAASNNSYLQANLALFKYVESTAITLSERGVQLPADLYATLNKHLVAATTYLEGCKEGTMKFSVETVESFRHHIVSAWEKLANHPTVKGALDKVQPRLISAKNATITNLLTLKDSKISQTYVVPAVEIMGTYAVKVQESARYQTYVCPYVEKAMSTEAYGLMEKRVAALVESLKADEQFHSSSESTESEASLHEVSVDSHSVDETEPTETEPTETEPTETEPTETEPTETEPTETEPTDN